MKVYCENCKHWASIEYHKKELHLREKVFSKASENMDILAKSDLQDNLIMYMTFKRHWQYWCFNVNNQVHKDTPIKHTVENGLIEEVNKNNDCKYFEEYIER